MRHTGAIYQTLVSTGQLQDTVILFQLDHGLEEKDRIWEGGTRIPQFIHWPAGNLPSTFEGLVSTIDIAPSLLDIAGILNDPASTGLYSMDGKSWKDAVYNANGEGDDWIANRCLFFESNEDRAIRCGCDKYMQLGSSSNEATVAIDAGWPGWEVGENDFFRSWCVSQLCLWLISSCIFISRYHRGSLRLVRCLQVLHHGEPFGVQPRIVQHHREPAAEGN